MLSHRNAKRAINRLRRWLKLRQNTPRYRRRVAYLRKVVTSLEKNVNWMVIIALESSGERLITAYPADKERQRQFMRGECRPVLPLEGK